MFEHFSNDEAMGSNYSHIPEYQLAGRYVKRLLEARTEGRRVHSWDHTLFVASNALAILDAYHKHKTSAPTENEKFSVYIAALLHDVIQPDDIRNDELREKMIGEWNLNVEGSEDSEGVKVFNYIVSELNEKISKNPQISNEQRSLIEKLITHKEQILEIYAQKENKNLTKLPWQQRSLTSRSLSLADLYGNLNPDMVVKYGTYLSADNVKKSIDNRIDVDSALDMLIKKVFLDFIDKPAADAKPKTHFSYNLVHGQDIVNDWKGHSPDIMNDFECFIKYIQILKDERELFSSHLNIKKVCKENGLGVYGMFSFWHREGAENPRITSQEVFKKYQKFLLEHGDLNEITRRNGLSEEEIRLLEKLDTHREELVRDIIEWQKKLVVAEESLGQTI